MERRRYNERRPVNQSNFRRGYQDDGRKFRRSSFDDFEGDHFDRSPAKRRRRDDFDSRGDYVDDGHYEKRNRVDSYFTRKGNQSDDGWAGDRRGGNYDNYQRHDNFNDSRLSRNTDKRRSFDRPEGNFQRRSYESGNRRGGFRKDIGYRSENTRGGYRSESSRGGYYETKRGGYRSENRGGFRNESRSYDRRDGIQRHGSYSRGGSRGRDSYSMRSSRGGSYMRRRDDYRSHYTKFRREYDDKSESEWSGIDEGGDEDEEEEDEEKDKGKEEEGDKSETKEKDEKTETEEEEHKVSISHDEETGPPNEEAITSMSKDLQDDLASSILLVLFDNFEGTCSLNMLRLELIMKDVAVFNNCTSLQDFLLKYKKVFLVTHDDFETKDELEENASIDKDPDQNKSKDLDESHDGDENVHVEKDAETDKADDDGKEQEHADDETTECKNGKDEKEESFENSEKELDTSEADSKLEQSSVTEEHDPDEETNEKKDDEFLEEGEEAQDDIEDDIEDKDDQLLVIATPTLRLCTAHYAKAGSCKGKCKALHVCRYFVLSKCDFVDSGKRCVFGHNMDSKYNKYIMRKSLLHKFPPRLAQKVLLSLKYRNHTTLPIICRYYNGNRCTDSRCHYLHICADRVRGFCKYGKAKCRHRHDLKDTQPTTVLKRYGITVDEENTSEDIFEALRRAMTKGRKGFPQERLDPKSKSVASGASETEKSGDEVIEYETVLKWQCRSMQQGSNAWVDIEEGNKLEERYQTFQKARKYTFTMGERESEIKFERMSGHTTGGIHLEFRRVHEKVPKKVDPLKQEDSKNKDGKEEKVAKTPDEKAGKKTDSEKTEETEVQKEEPGPPEDGHEDEEENMEEEEEGDVASSAGGEEVPESDL